MNEPCFVYLAENAESGHLKIGMSINPKRRMYSLSSNNRVHFTLLCQCECPSWDIAAEWERFLHGLYSAHRVPLEKCVGHFWEHPDGYTETFYRTIKKDATRMIIYLDSCYKKAAAA